MAGIQGLSGWIGTVLNAPDARALAYFYRDLLGWPLATDEPDWCTMQVPGAPANLAFQTEAIYERPVWPAAAAPNRWTALAIRFLHWRHRPNYWLPRGKSPSHSEWTESGKIDGTTTYQLFYGIDTSGGQSGSPVFRSGCSGRCAIAIHAYGIYGSAVTNRGTRITHSAYNNLLALR